MKLAISEAKGIPALVGLVEKGNRDSKKNAALALANLAYNDDIKVTIAEVGGIRALVQLLQVSSLECKSNAALALANLAYNDANKVRYDSSDFAS